MGKWYEDDPERLEAKAAGVALMIQGASQREAASEVGLPPATLWRAFHKAMAGTAQDEDLKKADQAAIALTYAIAHESQRNLLQQLEDKTLEGKDVVGAMKSSLLAISSFRRWQKPEPDASDNFASTRILDRLAHHLAEGGSLTLSVAGKTAESLPVIDVVPVDQDK